MTGQPEIKKIAVVGTGVIGSSWTTLFLAKGYQVIVSDPAPGARAKLADFIKNEWPRMQKAGLVVPGANPQNYEFVDDITSHLSDIDFVQENAPERVDFKTRLIGDLDAKLPAHAIIASSSSGIPSSQFIGNCKKAPERVLIGHPFNPPHLIPLVEVVPHTETSIEVTQRAIDFYKLLGKAPVLIKKEVPGFLANRLQAAILAEAYSLVNRGIASPEDVDTAISTGPGLRWALAGPFSTNILAGGAVEDPFKHFIEHLGPAVSGWKKDMDEHRFDIEDEEQVGRLEEDVRPFQEKIDRERLRREMGDGLIEVLGVKRGKGNLV
jgi:3-hydroxyacyl-CoA dehydrogenase